MLTEAAFKQLVEGFAPAIAASLDPLCVLNHECRIVQTNQAMRSMMGLTPRALASQPVFCDLVKLDACKRTCQIQRILELGDPFRVDEHPATLAKGEMKLRVLLKGVAIHATGSKEPAGVIIAMRDSTAELIVQAKYQKMKLMIDERDLKIAALEERMRKIMAAMRYKKV